LEIYESALLQTNQTNPTKMNFLQIKSSVLKQIIINQISLPDIVLDNIKSYVFYDLETYKKILHRIFNQKTALFKVIKNAYTQEVVITVHTNYYNVFVMQRSIEEGEISDDEYVSLEDYLEYNNSPYGRYTLRVYENHKVFEIKSNFCNACGNYTDPYLTTKKRKAIPMHHRCKCLC